MVEIIGAYVEGRPMPFSSRVLTKDASVNRGGGSVKCCMGFISLHKSSSFCSSAGRIVSVNFVGSILRNPSNFMTWPVALNVYTLELLELLESFLTFSASTDVVSKSACGIWDAMKRRHTRS